MKDYSKPVCTLLRIHGAAMMAASFEGSEITDDPTNRFDARRNILIDLEDDCFDE